MSISYFGRALGKHAVNDIHKVKVNPKNTAMARLRDYGNVKLGVW